MESGHVHEIEKVASLSQPPIGHYRPSGKMDTRRDTQSESNPKLRPVPRQPEVSRKHEEKQDKSTLNHINRLLKNVGSGNEPMRVVNWRICGSHCGDDDQQNPRPADQELGQPCEAGIGPENIRENLGDQHKRYQSLHQQAQPVSSPEVFRSYGWQEVQRI